MRRPWQEKGKQDGVVAIGLTKEMNATTVSKESDIERSRPM
jgi:hypothetical protein